MTRKRFKNYSGGESVARAQPFPQFTENPYKPILEIAGKGWKYIKDFIFGKNGPGIRYVDGDSDVELLDVEDVTRIANRYGLPGKHVGLYTEDDDKIRIAKDATKYGHDPFKVLLHERAHRAKAKGWVKVPDYVNEEIWADEVSEKIYNNTSLRGVRGFV